MRFFTLASLSAVLASEPKETFNFRGLAKLTGIGAALAAGPVLYASGLRTQNIVDTIADLWSKEEELLMTCSSFEECSGDAHLALLEGKYSDWSNLLCQANEFNPNDIYSAWPKYLDSVKAHNFDAAFTETERLAEFGKAHGWTPENYPREIDMMVPVSNRLVGGIDAEYPERWTGLGDCYSMLAGYPEDAEICLDTLRADVISSIFEDLRHLRK